MSVCRPQQLIERVDVPRSGRSMMLVCSKGTLDMAYPPLILASTAAALGYNVTVFFTFYGLQLLRKDLNLKVSPLGNPGMPMPMGMNKWFPVAGTALPGMEGMMTRMMPKMATGTRAAKSLSPNNQ